jgi:hypothetical protein
VDAGAEQRPEEDRRLAVAQDGGAAAPVFMENFTEFGTFLLATGRRPGPAEMPPVSYFGFEVIGPRELRGYRGGF